MSREKNPRSVPVWRLPLLLKGLHLVSRMAAPPVPRKGKRGEKENKRARSSTTVPGVTTASHGQPLAESRMWVVRPFPWERTDTANWFLWASWSPRTGSFCSLHSLRAIAPPGALEICNYAIRKRKTVAWEVVVQEHAPGVALQQWGGWWEGPRQAVGSARARGQPLVDRHRSKTSRTSVSRNIWWFCCSRQGTSFSGCPASFQEWCYMPPWMHQDRGIIML